VKYPVIVTGDIKMPLKTCTVEGKSGFQWGESGRCYTGPGARKKAIKQGVAAEGPEKFSQKAKEFGIYLSEEEIKSVLEEVDNAGHYDLASIVALAAILSTQSNEIAGYPPNCKDGYIEKDGKCVPFNKSNAMYAGYRTTSVFMDREGFGHFHTLKKDDDQTSKSRTKFGDIIADGHIHEIADGVIQPTMGHTHTVVDIGPGDGWVYSG